MSYLEKMKTEANYTRTLNGAKTRAKARKLYRALGMTDREYRATVTAHAKQEEMPAVVFHNVNSWQMQAPVTAHTKGAALQSGASTHALKEKFDGSITPMDHMLRVLNGERCSMIHA